MNKTLSKRTTPQSGNGASTYEPISSVWQGSDGELLELMFDFYAVIPPEPILDATYNAGRFWKGSKREVVSMDIEVEEMRVASIWHKRANRIRLPATVKLGHYPSQNIFRGLPSR